MSPWKRSSTECTAWWRISESAAITAPRSSTAPAPTSIGPCRFTATSQPCRWSPAMIGATAYSPTPPGSSWCPGTSRMPSAGERSASASTSAGVTMAWSARFSDSRRALGRSE